MKPNVQRKEHFGVKYCELCEKAYEMYSYSNERYISYYPSFPTYKLERVECPNHDKSHINQYIQEYNSND